MANYNKVILMGNLTRDPELRHSPSGTAVLKFGLAVNRKFNVQGEAREETCFVDVTAFGKQAEIIQQYVHKGDPIHIDGRLNYSSWETQDGQKRNRLDVVLENFQLMGGRSSGDAQQGRGAGASRGRGRAAPESEVDYGDIPF